MIENRGFLLLLLIGFLGFSQTKGLVVDENNKPIPYVNIWIENGNIGTTTEEDGRFSLEIKNQEKNLIFSALGFETKTIKATEAEKVVLKSVTIHLDEVVIKQNSVKQKMELGYYESGGFRYHMSHFVDGIYFNFSEVEKEKYPFINQLKFKTLSKNKNAVIRIYLVESNEDGSPSERTLSEEIIVEVKKGKVKNVIDLSSRKIAIPQNGFFIVFEKLKVEQNKYYEEYTFKDKNGNKTITKGMSYEPDIPLVPIEEAVGWHKQIDNKWQKSTITTIPNPNSFENILMKKYHNKYLVPSVNITISN
ncbi:hypothetical protein J2X31_002788 [Flavobacterium arsenatis]|uniref:Carboxypeptidase-like regulatory domain-containing protein n=1 Tax=Flavobacterium arsenatis TaxID=1484332 RepID=A0ABU1TSA9_9FLAO|nr:carboxypeptidase-like regulatory domain-containing protein [Flavobacterium arsenatis]MDR6968762.1 hypothetical protein [Flavobacterium arsenatis]